VKARLQRAKANLGSYFSGRCKWLGGEGGCSCESRIGFALSFAPDILQCLRNHPPDKAVKDTIRSSLGKVRDIDEIYRSLPMEPYKSEVLENYLKRA